MAITILMSMHNLAKEDGIDSLVIHTTYSHLLN